MLLTLEVDGNYSLYRLSSHAHHCNPFPILVDRSHPLSPVPPVRLRTSSRLTKRGKTLQTTPSSSTPRPTVPEKRFTGSFPRLGGRNREGSVDIPARGPRPRKNGIFALWGLKPLWAVARALGRFLRSFGRPLRRKASLDVPHPAHPNVPPLSLALSTHHDLDPPGWKRLISGPLAMHERTSLINTIFSDRHEVRVIGDLRGDDAQVFTDMVYEVYPCVLSSPKTKYTNFPSGVGLPRSRAKGEVSANFVQDLWPSGSTSEITEHPSLLGSSGSPSVPGRVCRCVEG